MLLLGRNVVGKNVFDDFANLVVAVDVFEGVAPDDVTAKTFVSLEKLDEAALDQVEPIRAALEVRLELLQLFQL